MKGKYIAPCFGMDAFHCPHCEVYAMQYWREAYIERNGGFAPVENLKVSFCAKCGKYALWINKKMIYPVSSVAPLPVDDMPENVKEDYMEARNIIELSPRAAAALLRLALQKLMVSLGETGKDLNTDIANLVKKGLPTTIQKALDSVRVIGNNAVHPGELDLRDDAETAIALFDLLNMVVTVMITQPKEVSALYDRIPKGAKEAIKKRDKSAEK